MKISSNFLNHLAFWFVTVFATPLFIAINNRDDVAIGLGALAFILLASTLVHLMEKEIGISAKADTL